MHIATTTTTSISNYQHCPFRRHQQQAFSAVVAAGQLLVMTRKLDVCGTGYLLGFPATQQDTARYTVDAYHQPSQPEAASTTANGSA